MNSDWFVKNKVILTLILVLGLVLVYVWKTEFTFVKFFNNNNSYVPGLQNPAPPNAAPPSLPTPAANESNWRSQFEKEREQ